MLGHALTARRGSWQVCGIVWDYFQGIVDGEWTVAVS